MGHSLVLPLLLLCLAAANCQTPLPQVSGDECGSGQVFPLDHQGATILGCLVLNNKSWCRREDNSFVICPSLPMPSIEGDENSPVRSFVSSPGPQVVITEVLVINDAYTDEDGETSDWLELHNMESEMIGLEGWALTDDPENPRKWVIPTIYIGPDQYIVIFASGKNRVSETAAHTNFRMKSDGEYLGLTRPDGSIASALASKYPRQIPNISYGIPDYPASQRQYTLLNEPTPGGPNSGPLESGPFIAGVELELSDEMPAPGTDLPIAAIVSQHLAPVASVTLVYLVMYQEEKRIPMNEAFTKGYKATIPATDFSGGEMVRWYVETTDTDGNYARDPPFVTGDWPQYYGTVISAGNLGSGLPVLHWFTNDPSASISEDGFRGSVFFKGRMYDNVSTRRRGVTSLSWPKPKIKFDFKGRVFKYAKGKSVEEFNLQSFWDEPGEDSYLREPTAFQVMQEAGVPASDTFYVRVQQNGQFFGLFAFIEQVEDGFLEKNGFNVQGPIFKAVHGELSNLRWDVKQNDLQFAYRKGNRKELNEWWALHELTQGLGGGGSQSRSSFMFDYLNLPEIINYMAVSNMLLNQDRCTKNYYVYRNPSDSRWSVFPWDLEGAFGISNGLGGVPAPDYCVLACEQWNSPLYCDSEHPQDLDALANIPIQTGRKLRQQTSPAQQTYRIPSPAEYDQNRVGGPSPTGAAGTYNHLDDAILDWQVTREMYFRRLRTLMDQFMNGRVQDMLKENWALVQSEANIDNQKWALTVDPSKGLEQLLTEQIPTRKAQLLETYGPGGLGLIPPSQNNDAVVQIVAATSAYVQITNENAVAVDISNWNLSGDSSYRFPPGTVVASGGSVFVVPDINTFRNRNNSPKGGEGLFVVGPSSAITGGSFALVNQFGQTV